MPDPIPLVRDLPETRVTEEVAALAVHLHDSLGVLNAGRTAGAITEEQWEAMMYGSCCDPKPGEAPGADLLASWARFERVFGVSISTCVREYCAVVLGEMRWRTS